MGWYGHGARSNWIIAFGIVRDPGRDRRCCSWPSPRTTAGHRPVSSHGRSGRSRPVEEALPRRRRQSELESAWTRLTQLRLTLGGLIGDGELGPPVCVALRGLGRLGQGRRDQAAGRPARPAPRPRRPVRGADPRREAPPLPLALLAGAARLGRDGRLRPLLVRARAGRAGRGVRHARSSGGAPTTRSTASSATLADEGMILIKFWMHISAEEQLKRFERAREGPAEDLEADRRGLAQPREARRLRGGGRGHARAHRASSRTRPGT